MCVYVYMYVYVSIFYFLDRAFPLWHTWSEDTSILEAELKERILSLTSDPRTYLAQAPDESVSN